MVNFPIVSRWLLPVFIFLPDKVLAGEWWRVLTHPWVHASWYHGFLDVSAFVLLYLQLQDRDFRAKLAYVFCAGAGSLLAAWGAAPAVQTIGFCGLSGVAHGLLAVVSLQWISAGVEKPLQRALGSIAFTVVAGKCVFEAMQSSPALAPFHFGMMGTPILVCHAGGALGGIAGFVFEGLSNRGERDIRDGKSNRRRASGGNGLRHSVPGRKMESS